MITLDYISRSLFVWTVVLLFGAAACSPIETPQEALPNVLLIVTDDQGYGDVGFHGNSIVETPNIDQLAQESIIFDRFYVSPVCAPTRASLLTGRYHLATGVSWVTHRKEVMSQHEVTLAELLKAQGYNTGLFGKWHNGKQYPHDPLGQGFDTFLGFTDGHFNNYFDAKLINGFDTVHTKGYMPDVLTDAAIQLMQDDEPFFAYVSYNTPHSPFQVPDQYFDKYKSKGLDDKNACIYGMIENIDDNVSRLLKALEESGKIENTMVIFMTDNGPNGLRYNAGLKGIKSHVDEGGVRVPFTIRYPKKNWTGGKIINSMAGHIDVFPTLAALISPNYQPKNKIHGKSLVDLIDEGTVIQRSFFTHQVVRKFDTIPGAIRAGEFLLTLKLGDTALFNLANDKFQENNLFKTSKYLSDSMITQYLEWIRSTLAQMPKSEQIETGHEQVRLVEFPAQEVSSRINVDFKGKEGWANDYLTNFSQGAAVTWETKTIKDQDYQFYLEMAGEQGAEIEWILDGVKRTFTLTEKREKLQMSSPDRVPRGEVYEFEWPMINMGDYRLSSGTHSIEVRAKSDKEVEIKSLKLKRI